ncbi:MAG: phosphatase [Lachnospiraceae bacterium]|nr:phosphatase [Lachnospiraceae bacterium]MBR4060542.1 phosphatase [Lachnospiraceae bacterium]
MKYIIDLHTHSIAGGHAYSTFQENVAAAYAKGLSVYGFSEHAPAMPGGPHPYFFENFKVLPDEYKGMRVLKGCEANIIDLEGHFDLDDSVLARMDYVIASMHLPCVTSGTARENTDCLIKVMDNPAVQIIGHPDDSRYPLEYDRLVQAAGEKRVLLEVNNTSLSPKSFRKGGLENVQTYLSLCKEYGVPVIVGTDSHFAPQIGDFTYADKVLKDTDFPEELVVNTSVEKLREYIRGV